VKYKNLEFLVFLQGEFFFSLFSGWRICIPIESGFIQPDFFFLFRHFLLHTFLAATVRQEVSGVYVG